MAEFRHPRDIIRKLMNYYKSSRNSFGFSVQYSVHCSLVGLATPYSGIPICESSIYNLADAIESKIMHDSVYDYLEDLFVNSCEVKKRKWDSFVMLMAKNMREFSKPRCQLCGDKLELPPPKFKPAHRSDFDHSG